MSAWQDRPPTNGLCAVRCLRQTEGGLPYGYVALWIRLDGRQVTFCHGQALSLTQWEPLSLARGDLEWYGPIAFEEEEH